MATRQFQTEVSQLLHLIIHSLYSHKEIFLRELVSNASDALDKLKYLTLADDAYKSIQFDARVDITFDKDNKTLTIEDNGIGMNEGDLEANLGTIARSGTKAFLEQLTAESKKDSNLIGQFGVGFYSAFMVADHIEVISRKAGEDTAWKWSSNGKDGYEIEESSRETQGTSILLHLNDEGVEYTNRWSIEDIIKRYSNHVAFPIFLHFDEQEYDDKGKVKSSTPKIEQINSASALWRRSRNELKDEDYNEFYKQISHDNEDPLFHVHTRAEGTLEYTTLFYVPQKAPFDLYNVDYKSGVKLYVKRVFITDDDKELLPTWLRFVRGVIDSEDLPLNVSREILQQNRILQSIRNASVKKLLGEFKSLADNDKEKYQNFIEQFNRPLKEGLYQDFANREAILDLVRFKSSTQEGWTSLAEYVDRMGSDQKIIYYISGGDEKTLRASPLLEAWKAKGIEVLIMSDDIDDIVMPSVNKYKEWDIKAVNRAGADKELGEASKEDKASEKQMKPLLEKLQKALGDKVKEVKLSRRLHDSPSCIVADENDPSIQLAQMMKAMGQMEMPEIKPILEVNAKHPILQKLLDEENEERIADVAGVLLDQALLVEGIKLKDPADFVKRLNRLL
jgi:molecular chaperone HtpG